MSNDLIRERRSEAARLKAQGADVNADKRTGEILGAWRRDVFTILRNRHGKPTDGFPKGRPALSQRAYEAFRGHESDIHLSEGASGGDRRPDFIRATCEGAPGQNVTQEAIDAAGRVKKTLQGLSPSDARLLMALMTGEKALAPDRPDRDGRDGGREPGVPDPRPGREPDPRARRRHGEGGPARERPAATPAPSAEGDVVQGFGFRSITWGFSDRSKQGT